MCLETVFRPQGTKTQDTNKIYSMNTVCIPYVYVEFNQTGTESIRGKAVNRRYYLRKCVILLSHAVNNVSRRLSFH